MEQQSFKHCRIVTLCDLNQTNYYFCTKAQKGFNGSNMHNRANTEPGHDKD